MEKRRLIERPVQTKSQNKNKQLQGARFSRDRKYRYQLWRTWDSKIRQRAVFVGLNPSAADEQSNDPTIRRCVNFAKGWKGSWRCGGLAVVNLFGYCTHDPAFLKQQREPYGCANTQWLHKTCADADARVICIWGNHGEFDNASDRFLNWCNNKQIAVYALRINTSGQPAHPLYLPSTLKPFNYNSAQMPASDPLSRANR